ncbi:MULTISPECIES: anacyclamide/piricyclamide family prenylated cyclic peptide [unclassified Microcoleus]|uniref:anacyclamide/piricyclamide family prenylated cyclic peptide n=1 Tax=unclassified Microcoleus TaxID=2642155 RepID=UPI0040407C1F
MKKKSLRPQIVAPVQRESTATSTSRSPGLVALRTDTYLAPPGIYFPFAGEDAE